MDPKRKVLESPLAIGSKGKQMGNEEESEGEEMLHNNVQQPVEGSGGEGNVMW